MIMPLAVELDFICIFKASFDKENYTSLSNYRALGLEVCAHRPTAEVLVHSDQGSQYGSGYCSAFMEASNLEPSVCR